MTIAQIHQILDKLQIELEKKGIDTDDAKILEMEYKDENTFVFEYRPSHHFAGKKRKNFIDSIEISMLQDEFKPVSEFPDLLQDKDFQAGYNDAQAKM
jgi:hypothetical protein